MLLAFFIKELKYQQYKTNGVLYYYYVLSFLGPFLSSLHVCNMNLAITNSAHYGFFIAKNRGSISQIKSNQLPTMMKKVIEISIKL